MQVSMHNVNRKVQYNETAISSIHWLTINEIGEGNSGVTLFFDTFQQAVEFKDMIVDALAEFAPEGKDDKA